MQSEVIIQSHGFEVVIRNKIARTILHSLVGELIEWDRTEGNHSSAASWVINKKWWVSCKAEGRYFVCKGLLSKFLTIVHGTKGWENHFKIISRNMYEPRKVEFDTKNMYEPFANQIPVIDHISNFGDKGTLSERTRGTRLQAGKGKTLCGIAAAAKLGGRIMIHMAPKYVKRWVPDLTAFLGLEKKDLCVIRGSAHLEDALQLALDDDLDFKVMIIGHNTLDKYLKSFESDEFSFCVEPKDFYEVFDIKTTLIDEIHEWYAMIFKWHTVAHMYLSIGMSATFDSRDHFKAKMYKLMHPDECWIDMKYHAYVNAYAMLYHVNPAMHYRYTQRGRKSYSHNVYEESIMANRVLLNDYLEMIYKTTLDYFYYAGNYQVGAKCLIIFARKDLCEVVMNYFRNMTPIFKLATHVFGSDLDETVKADIIFSTAESMGTGQDIPHLKTVMLTRALGSFEKNEQIKGRLRELRSGDFINMDLDIVYFTNVGLSAPVKYHETKMVDWKKKVLKHKLVSYSKTLGEKTRVINYVT